MRPYFERKHEMEKAISEYSRTPANRRLKYCTYVMISLCAILLLASAFFLDNLEYKTILIMRGCAGLCALICMVSYGALLYRAHSAYWRNRNTPK